MLFLPTTIPNSPSGMTQSWLTTSQYETSYLDSWNDTCLASHGARDTLSMSALWQGTDIPFEISEDLWRLASGFRKGDIQLRHLTAVYTAGVLDIGGNSPPLSLEPGISSMSTTRRTNPTKRPQCESRSHQSRPSNKPLPAYPSFSPLRPRSRQH
jgi:hypothetical protein